MTDTKKEQTGLMRATGLLVIEVVNSNPNGDPDNESEPRTRVGDRGEISPVSFKRKLRDLVEQKDGPVWQEIARGFDPRLVDGEFDILEKRGRDRKKIEVEIKDGTFVQKYWDGRIFGNAFLFGNTFLEEGSSTSIKTGVVQFGMGISVAPVEIQRHTLTNKSGVQEGKDRGMAPLGYRVVQHGVYCIPFYVNPSAAYKSGCTQTDIDLMLRLIPYAYTHTASFVRPDVRIRHAWYVEHKSRLGSCPDYALIDALTPAKKEEPGAASQSWADYTAPAGLPPEVRGRVASCVDLVEHEWKTAGA
jgi:Cas7 group CRISPR-associated protein Csh2